MITYPPMKIGRTCDREIKQMVIDLNILGKWDWGQNWFLSV